MRFEWFEILLRVAIQWVTRGSTETVVEGIFLLVRDLMVHNLPALALTNADDFRRYRMYVYKLLRTTLPLDLS